MSHTVIDTKSLHVYSTREGSAVCSACPQHTLSAIAELDLTSITLSTSTEVVKHLSDHVLMNHKIPKEYLQEEFWEHEFERQRGSE